MNIQQKRIARNWRGLLWNFAKTEWLSILLWSGLGAVGAGLLHLLAFDHAFQVFLEAKYLPAAKRFDDVRIYFPDIFAAALVAVMAVMLRLPDVITRGFKSWIAGVTSGLCLFSFTSALLILSFNRWTIERRLLTDAEILGVWFALGFLLHLKGKIQAKRTLSEKELRVPLQTKSLVGTDEEQSDDPIQSWSEDTLGRAALVENISIRLIIARTPVLALFGEFGSGKTSILNLLREHLAPKAIVVSFSTWLPGSQETLTSYLLADIATECQKHYMVPGLRKSSRRLAAALSQSVPFLKGYSALVPAATQRDDIESVGAALERLPKRVVVLLDDIDRMERLEVLTLLKVIRGISVLRNLSFVCASNRETLVSTVRGEFNDESNLYFDKFFPVSIQVPNADEDSIRKAGVERLVATFKRRGWFDDKTEEDSFRDQIEIVWKECIAPFCRNLRAIGILANDVGLAASLLEREVHPVDLTLIELLRRFRPAVYEIIERNSIPLTGGERLDRGGSFHSSDEIRSLRKVLFEEFQRAGQGDDQFEYVRKILSQLFPEFVEIGIRSWTPNNLKPESRDEEKRIYHPGMFPAYFRYELPQAMFSSVELDIFLRAFTRAGDDADRTRIFSEELRSMEKGDPKRDDFLRKLSDAAQWQTSEVGKSLVRATMQAADQYVYDSMFIGSGEAGHVLRIILRVSEKTPKADRAKLLSQAILETTDDTMALRILTALTKKQDDLDLDISFAELYPAFIQRMRKRYGRDVDATRINLGTSDPFAFNLWGTTVIKDQSIAIDPEDRNIQHDFWRRYIGDSRARLAQAFQAFIMPVGIYTEDPALAVENKMSFADLKELSEELPDTESLTESERKSLLRLGQFLNGDFKNGIDIGQLSDSESATVEAVEPVSFNGITPSTAHGGEQ